MQHANPAVAVPDEEPIPYCLSPAGARVVGAPVVFGVTVTPEIERAIRAIRVVAGAAAMGSSPAAIGCWIAEAIRSLDAVDLETACGVAAQVPT